MTASQPLVGGLISSSPFIKPIGQGNWAPATQVTGAMSVASGLVTKSSTLTPVSSDTMDVHSTAKDFDRQGTTSPVSQSSVVKPTSEIVELYQPPVTGAIIRPSTCACESVQYPNSTLTNQPPPPFMLRKGERSPRRKLVLCPRKLTSRYYSSTRIERQSGQSGPSCIRIKCQNLKVFPRQQPLCQF